MRHNGHVYVNGRPLFWRIVETIFWLAFLGAIFALLAAAWAQDIPRGGALINAEGIFHCSRQEGALICLPAANACSQPIDASAVHSDAQAYCHARYQAKRFASLAPEGRQRLINACTIAERKRQ